MILAILAVDRRTPQPIQWQLYVADRDVRQPDLVVVHRDRMDIVRLRGIFGVPDLVVEVLSPGSFQRDRVEKWATYSKYGVPEYWVADPVNGTLDQYLWRRDQLSLSRVYEADECVSSERLPCVKFTMGDLLRIRPREDGGLSLSRRRNGAY